MYCKRMTHTSHHHVQMDAHRDIFTSIHLASERNRDENPKDQKEGDSDTTTLTNTRNKDNKLYHKMAR